MHHRGNKYSLTEFWDKVKMNELENKIIQYRTMDKDGIWDCNDAELKKDIFDVILRISFISGCKLPDNEKLLDFFVDELIDFLREYGYATYAAMEILLAFRININTVLKMPSGITIEKIKMQTENISVEYISEVLHNYSIIRNCLDRKFQNHIDGHN